MIPTLQCLGAYAFEQVMYPPMFFMKWFVFATEEP
jgi:hypothetical protein